MAHTNNLPPEDLIYDEILTRLPVKSLLRFKSVCKSWESVISSFGFIKSQLSRAISNPQNDYLFLHSGYYPGAELNDEVLIVSPNGIYEPDIIDNDYDYDYRFCIVHSVNGLICVFQGPHWISRKYNGQIVFHIWNPATKRVVSVQHHIPGAKLCTIIWSGMGYDPLQNDYKIICIVNMEGEGKGPSEGHIYSINAGCWRHVHLGVEFPLFKDQKYVVNVNGCPYWMHDQTTTSDRFNRINQIQHDRLTGITFDVQNSAFKLLPELFLLKNWGYVTWSLLNWKGSLSTMIYRKTSRQVDFYCLKSSSSSGGSFWSKIYTVGSVDGYPWLCFKNGDILLDNYDGYEWLSYDRKSCTVESLGRRYGCPNSAFSYVESLVFVKGMKPCMALEFLR